MNIFTEEQLIVQELIENGLLFVVYWRFAQYKSHGKWHWLCISVWSPIFVSASADLRFTMNNIIVSIFFISLLVMSTRAASIYRSVETELDVPANGDAAAALTEGDTEGNVDPAIHKRCLIARDTKGNVDPAIRKRCLIARETGHWSCCWRTISCWTWYFTFPNMERVTVSFTAATVTITVWLPCIIKWR